MELLDGYTLTHEHMCIDLTPGDLGTDSFTELCADLRELRRYGVHNIVDLTNQSMGRDAAYVRRLEEATGMNIIVSTGFYLERYSGALIEGRTIGELAREVVRDLREGVDGSDTKAQVIGEIAWSAPVASPLELRAWEALALAAVETGAPVSTHTSVGPQQLMQARFLIERGVEPGNIVIGHIEWHPDDEALKTLLDLGVYVGVDMIGKTVGEGDEARADVVAKAKAWGKLPQVMLSCDLCRKQDLKAAGGYGYAHLFERFIPMLVERGITREDVELMLRDNPRRWLAHA